jgi:plasmid maintenance system killer protein
MVEFKFITYGTDFGTRDMGQKLREKLLPLINGEEKVVLDFTGVNVVSNSFADECIAKLLLEMPLAELKRRTTFRGLNPLAERSILVALQRRYKVLSDSENSRKTRKCPRKKTYDMSQQELTSYRLSSLQEPTDDMLHAIMEQVAESARRSTAKFQAELHRRFEMIRTSSK